MNDGLIRPTPPFEPISLVFIRVYPRFILRNLRRVFAVAVTFRSPDDLLRIPEQLPGIQMTLVRRKSSEFPAEKLELRCYTQPNTGFRPIFIPVGLFP